MEVNRCVWLLPVLVALALAACGGERPAPVAENPPLADAGEPDSADAGLLETDASAQALDAGAELSADAAAGADRPLAFEDAQGSVAAPDASLAPDCALWPDAEVQGPADVGPGLDAESFDAGPEAVLVGAGDIASCAHPAWSETTAKLLDAFPEAVVFAAGDESNDEGTADQYTRCFLPSWGRHLGRMRAAMGNHDAKTSKGAPYYAFFGASAGPAWKGYYSFEAGSWHVIVLNSNCDKAGGCSATSPQGRWLAADLAAHPARCTLAIWHHPLFSSVYGGTSEVGDFWTLLHAAGAELVINGHDHVYERYAPQDPDGNADPQGLRQIIVGTGGAGNSPFPSASFQPNSEAHSALALGIIKLTLRSGSYRWEFVPEPGKAFTDWGEGQCH